MHNICILIFFIAAHKFRICLSQEKPFYTIPKFSNESVQQDFCALHRLVEAGQIERRDALRGMNLHPGLLNFYLNEETGAIDEDNPDIAVLFLDEFALRAGFQWRNTYGLLQAPENETWTDLLVWAGGAYDLVGEWFTKSEERMTLGALFSEGWTDASMIMVISSNDEGNGNYFLNFLRPFTYGLWGLIILTLIVTGFIYYLVDYLDSRRYAKEMDLSLQESIFNSAWVFTGHSLHEPKSTATRVLVLSLSFLCLMLVAAYTANLVSFLVSENTSAIVLDDLEDVVRHDLSCCVDSQSRKYDFMISSYPTAKLVPIKDPDYGKEIYHALSRSECDVLLSDLSTYEIRKRSEVYNPDCNLEWVGRKIDDRQGHFGIMHSAKHCTSLLSEVLAIHMMEMKKDKTYDNIWNSYLSRSATEFCTAAKEQNEGDNRLSISNMLGIFVLYLAVLLALILWSLCQFFRMKYQIYRKSVMGSQSLTRAVQVSSNEAPAQEENLMIAVPSGMNSNIGQENVSSDRSKIDLCATEALQSSFEGCKENMTYQFQKIWDKLLDIEKERQSNRHELHQPTTDRHELHQLTTDLSELLQGAMHEQLLKDLQSRKSFRHLKLLIDRQCEHLEQFEKHQNEQQISGNEKKKL